MVIRSTLWLILNFIVGKVLIVFWQFYLARFFTDSPEQYGYYRLLITQYSIWQLLADGSLGYAVQQFIAEDGHDPEVKIKAYWPFIFGARVITGLLAGIIFIFIIGLKYPSLIVPSIFLSLSALIFSIGTAPLGLWAGLGDFRTEAKSGLISTPFYIGIALIVTLLTKNITILICCTLISQVVSGVYIWWTAIRKWGLPKKITESFQVHGMKFLRFCFPLTISAFSFMFFYRADMMLVTDKFGAVEAGVYSIALMIFSIFCELIWGQFGKAYTPNLIACWNNERKLNDNETISAQLRNILACCSIISTLGLITVALFGGRFFSLIFGGDSVWVKSVVPFFWLLTGFMPVVLYSLTYRILLLEKGSTGYMILSLATIVLKYVCVSLYATELGLQGIALINSIFMFVLFVLMALMIEPMGKKILLDMKLLFYTFAPVIILLYGLWINNDFILRLETFNLKFSFLLLLSMFASIFLNYNGVKLMVSHLFLKKKFS